MEKLKKIHDRHIEECVIAALVIDYNECYEALLLLHEDCFYDDFCRKIFGIIKKLAKDGKTIDLATTGSKIEQKELSELIAITQRVASALNVLQHSKLLLELNIRRQLIDCAFALQNKAHDKFTPVDGIVGELQQRLQRMFDFGAANVTTVSSVIDDIFQIMHNNSTDDRKMTGIMTGLTELDRFTGGLQPTDLVIIAGETSQGKTSLALTISKNAAMYYNVKVAYYSLEMSKTQLVARLMSQETEIQSKVILTQKIEAGLMQHITDRTWQLSAANIYFDDSSSTSLDSILRSIRMLNRRYGVTLVVIDFLQIISGAKGESREQEVAGIARSLKNLAKDLNICIIALSQLRRTNDHIPSLNRLRDSGQIEEAADTVIFTYCPEVYRIDSYKPPFENYSPYGTALIDIAKGRNTGTFQFIASFTRTYTLFKDYDSGHYEQPKEEIKLKF
jgi:replicative DNA helicase